MGKWWVLYTENLGWPDITRFSRGSLTKSHGMRIFVFAQSARSCFPGLYGPDIYGPKISPKIAVRGQNVFRKANRTRNFAGRNNMSVVAHHSSVRQMGTKPTTPPTWTWHLPRPYLRAKPFQVPSPTNASYHLRPGKSGLKKVREIRTQGQVTPSQRVKPKRTLLFDCACFHNSDMGARKAAHRE